MQCPRCHHNSLKVVDSRPADEGRAIRRRRECENCGYRFTTFERIEQTPLLVIKKNGTREEFNREKIMRGLVRAAEKRPVTMDQMTEIVDKIEHDIRQTGDNEIRSDGIGELVMKYLAGVDDVAYIRFASVYRQFKDMNVFMKEVQEMMAREKDSDATHEK
ncbi:transcriptional regulator NrdR [Lapidilactobacillus concavus DSM 17758]|jgi:transcriptional repressor NrdR|uniref:Transcriptional repressor NrdR n=1 Tax=Lapidilactobacillus concavus DSM 17758 TaxID=1423735 RepID=A0A0R1W117_9LACO|nr:transcriptional regulator NrdR [Lapidilactobacillus concavus]KRM11285.1 transcriptional regulator NrdR [Lapidilactobacillus concavus DSM 17758]GEL13469.1 transcriptional repressor NrdR [Lapidilactobacillus concavus]